MINVRLREGLDWTTHDPLRLAQREIEAELGSAGRILIRPSGTEPLLRVMVEARDQQVASLCAQRLAQTLEV
jgi:phosphoglucosamine mutase